MTRLIAGVIVLVGLLFVVVGGVRQSKEKTLSAPLKNMHEITLKSSAFENGAIIPARFTCDAENVNPPLEIVGIPAETKTLALIMHDPDAPVSGGWTHWIKFNIPPETRSIREGQEPTGISGKGGRENLVYKGPCPPFGTHRYFFKLYALDTVLSRKEGIGKDELESAMEGHIVGYGELMGLYSRK